MRPKLGVGMSKRSRQEQMWVDKEFKAWLKDIIRKKIVMEKPKHDFSFADITSDIIRCTELRNGIEAKLLERRIKNESKLF